MNRKLYLIILISFLSIVACYSQSNLTDTQKLRSASRIWGFLKYYHPEVAKGTFNWDKQLIEILPEVKKAETKEQLSQVYINWINSLGKVKKCSSCNKSSKNDYFLKNFDLSWIQDSTLFTSELFEKLKFIENNRNQKENHYVSPTKYVGNVIVTNEPRYDNFEYPEEPYRLLCLFKYWNIIEYFYPYKYLTDTNWNDVLTGMIPKYINAQNATEYHLALLETVAKIDDSHTPLIYTKELGNYFGKYGFPIKYRILNDKIVITGFRGKNVENIDDLRIGDAILEIDGVTIKDLIESNSKYIPASNPKGERRNWFLILAGDKQQALIKFERDGEIYEKIIHRYDLSTLEKREPVIPDKTKWKKLDENIAYVNVGNVEIPDVENVMDSVINSKAIIFDIRNYPNGNRVMRRISVRLNPQSKVFARVIVPDLSYPGKFIWEKGIESGINNKNYYKGKVIILVNGYTQSHAEYFTMCLQNSPHAITIGNQTAGADGNVSQFELVGGLKTAMSGTGIFYPDGTETQRKGVKIDIEVPYTLQGIIEGKDEILERALLFLKSNQ